MTRVTEAIFEDGVLRPITPLDLEEHQRVRVILSPIDGLTVASREEALLRLRRGIDGMKFRSDGAYPHRDELHDRV